MAASLPRRERAGLAALEDDIPPEALAGRITAALNGPAGVSGAPDDDGRAAWWTDGSPLVAPQTVSAPALPSPAQFTAMIAGSTGEPPS